MNEEYNDWYHAHYEDEIKLENQKNALALKVYEIDYSFIIKNYLNRELWKKEWTLFIYKDYVFTLRLASINVMFNSIKFLVKHNKGRCYDWHSSYFSNYDDTIEISYSLESNVNILKKQINGAMFRLIENIEMSQICHSDEYIEIAAGKDDEKEVLRDIAIGFLDENGVTNDTIRDVYIDHYVDENMTIDSKLSEYKSSKKYNVLTDLYLLFCEITEDEGRKENVLEKLDETKANEVLNEVREYMKKLETEEFVDELKENLESL